MLFRRALTQISPQNFSPDSKTKCLQLRLSTEFPSILEEIKQKHTLIFQLYGEPGSGCSTLVQGLCQHLCEIEHIAEKEILYLSLNQYCNEKSLWEFMSDLAKERNYKEQATFFSATSEKKDEKIKRFLGFFNFKVVCFDNADCNDGLVESFLEHLVCSKIKTFIIGTQTRQIQTNEQVSTIEVRGLNLSTAQELFKKLCPSCAYEDGQISSLCGILKYNPIAINFFCALVNSHKLDATQLQLSKGERQVDMFALDWILDYIKQSLGPSYISILYQLCHLRRPLPMTEVTPEISKLMELNLLTVKKEGSVNFIAIDLCLQKHLSHRKDNKTAKDTVNETADFSVLECWLSLVSNKLQRLVQDAEENAWPFVPEKWQFIQNVGKEENYNVKELLTSRNIHVGFLTELQILQECLYHAYVEENFKKMAALVLVLDRFLYWQGEGKIAMDIVDHIQSRSPQTAIAPQLVIRRVRFMKSNGSLQEAEETLNRLLQAKSRIGQWKYRKEDDFHLVSGVCVQIKGEIQYRLGLWSKGAALLIQSLGFFGSLPQPDKKGLASSYGLLSLCLRNMTVQDYAVLAQTFGLFQCHPLLAAYFSGQEAAKMSVYAPMLFLRNICQAGEVLLEFLNLIPDKNEKQHLLKIAIEDLKDSIQAHQSYASLTSREQFYLLVCAVYKISLALFQIGSNEDKEKGMKLKDLSTELYEHYCSSSDRVSITKTVIGVVDQCLSLLGLQAFSQDNLANAGEVLVNYFKMRKTMRQRQNTSLSSVGFFDNLVKPDVLSVPRVSKQNQRNQDLKKTVDQCTGTAEIQEEQQVHQDQALDGTVDRCTGTAEIQEEQQVHQDQTLDGTVDRHTGTAEIQEEQQVHQDQTLDGTVDQCTGTAEIQEEQQVHQDQTLDGTVDRCTGIAEIQEEQREHQTLPKLPEQSIFQTVDQPAQTNINAMEEGGQEIVVQSLADEAANLPWKTMEPLTADKRLVGQQKTANVKANRVKDGTLWKYDYPSSQWRGQSTMVYIGDQLKLAKGKEGKQRDVYTVEFINQDEQLGRYVAKRYRKSKYQTMQQYQNDVLSQMTAKQYVALFNQQLYQKAAGAPVGDIQFLPVVLLQLVNSNGQTEIFNAEPYMSGEFIKLTNNTDWINKHRRTDLVLAYSHFTYQASDGKLIIVDIQGWAPLDNQGCTFLTDPQIHSTVYKCFGTGNFGKEGYDNFWKMHSECNQICKMLKLKRPFNK
ncbi:alpha-protein kinase 1-like isoform X2 [Actinia tenebrosa]|uniref:Alpha-protein kinase 1-like isoform X2 n=1 Tax=Actinia tenebrosa TaxID=6105 RepID=A0A6P8JF30_ACTTE|nr:alpha-protein kinase 1-like isoform X2 [Actinia tenebrosa]